MASFCSLTNHKNSNFQVQENKRFVCLITYIRAWVSMGAKGAWHPLNFWTVMSGTRWFWQFYYTMLCCTLAFWEFASDWHPLFQISNSSPVYDKCISTFWQKATFKHKINLQIFLYMSVFISLTSFKVKSDMSEYCTQNKLDVWDYKCNLSCIHICTFMVKNSSAPC